MVDFGMPQEMREALAKKYAIMQQQANAQTVDVNARARLMAEEAKTKVPLANSAIAVDKQNNAYTGMKIVEEPKNFASERDYRDALRNQINAGLPFVPDKLRAEINSLNSGARQNDASAVAALQPLGSIGSSTAPAQSAAKRIFDAAGSPPPMTASSPMGDGGASAILGASAPMTPIMQLNAPAAPSVRRKSSSSMLDLPSFTSISSSLFKDDEKAAGGMGYKFKRGTARVPGKGTGDIKPAMLEPGEAVLNKHAAGMMGRDKIAKLNAKGNEKRAKQEGQKVSKLAQALKQMGMV